MHKNQIKIHETKRLLGRMEWTLDCGQKVRVPGTSLKFSVLGKSLKTCVSLVFLIARVKWFLICSKYWVIKEFITIIYLSSQFYHRTHLFPPQHQLSLPTKILRYSCWLLLFLKNLLWSATASITLSSLCYKHNTLIYVSVPFYFILLHNSLSKSIHPSISE